MTGFDKLLAADQRLAALQLLSRQPGYMANLSVLQDGLDMMGHRVSGARTTALVDWLRDSGFIAIEDLGGGVRLVKITQRGLEVAEGRTVAGGVKRPRPED